MNKLIQIDNNRIFESWIKFKDSESTSFWPNKAFHFFSSGREALFALLNQPQYLTKKKNNVLLPAFLPEGIIYPFKKKNWEITFYNVDAQGNPIWKEIPKEMIFDIAILIHLFGYLRDAGKFKAHLSTQTLFIEDFAHCLPSNSLKLDQQAGDYFLFSLPKLIGLPDGAILVTKNRQTILPKSTTFSIQKSLYLNLNMASIFFHTLYTKWKVSTGRKAIKYLGILSYILAYKILMRFCHQPHQMSKISQYLYSKIDFKSIEKKRIQFAQLYTQQLNNPHIQFEHQTSPLAQIGFPIFCQHRDALILHLNEAGIFPTIFKEGWNFIPDNQRELFKSSKHLLEYHILLPLHHKLSTGQIERIIQTINNFQR